MRRLDSIVFTANQYYMQILMITGPSPDKYTDYYVHREIPELLAAVAVKTAKLVLTGFYSHLIVACGINVHFPGNRLTILPLMSPSQAHIRWR